VNDQEVLDEALETTMWATRVFIVEAVYAALHHTCWMPRCRHVSSCSRAQVYMQLVCKQWQLHSIQPVA
jgi:hypothetical protein